MSTLALWLALALFATAAAPGNWPSFRGADAAGLGDAPAPADWSVETGKNVRWKVAVPGLGHSSPIVWGDRVFVTTAVSSAPATDFPAGLNVGLEASADLAPQAWKVLCYDKRDGKLLWERTLHEGVPRSKRHRKNSFATPTPATDGKRLVVWFGSEGLYALDLDGKLLWKRDLGTLDAGFYADPRLQWGIGASPILYGDLVIVQADVDKDAFLAAFDAATGEPAWRTAREDKQSWSTPTVYRGAPRDELVTLAPKHVRAYDPRTGRELWRLRWDMDIIQSTPVVAGGLIYITSGKGVKQPILAIRPGGSGDLTLPEGKTASEHIVWSLDRGGPITTSPLVLDGYLYALSDQGVLRVYTAATGAEVYKQRLPTEFMASPVAAGGKVYLPGENGDYLVVRAGPKYELLATNSMGEVCLPTPALADGLLIVRTQHHLYAIAEPAAPAAAPAKGGAP